MLNIPLLITRPEVKEVAESVAKRTGQEVSPAHVMYDSPDRLSFSTANANILLASPGPRLVDTVSSPSR